MLLVSWYHVVLVVGCNGGAHYMQVNFGGRKHRGGNGENSGGNCPLGIGFLSWTPLINGSFVCPLCFSGFLANFKSNYDATTFADTHYYDW